MIDIRVQKLARVLIHHSLSIQPGNTLRIRGSVAALPLLQAAYYEALKAGALIIARLDHDSFQEMLLRDGTPGQLAFVNPLLIQESVLICNSTFVGSKATIRACASRG